MFFCKMFSNDKSSSGKSCRNKSSSKRLLGEKKTAATLLAPVVLFILTFCAVSVEAQSKSKFPVLQPEIQAAILRDDALLTNVAYQWTSDLTTRGPRPAGSAAERSAAEWAVTEFKKLGFDTAVIESFPYHPWLRGAHDLIEITSPYPQKLLGVALGGSTGGEVEAEAAVFDSWQTFLDSTADVNGKIVVVTQPMPRASDGSGYGSMSSPIRRLGPAAAQKRGAVGFVLRSLSTDTQRFPHAGGTAWSDGKGIPSMAIATPDAAQLDRIVAMQKKGEAGPLRLKIVSGASFPGLGSSVNVVAEIKGSEHPEQVVVIGGHLDSWDLGVGAIDDAVGHAIAIAAAKNILDHKLRPKRTIRVVLWGSEEMPQPTGFSSGGGNYAKMHAAEAPNMIVAMEADFGAGRVYAATLPATKAGAFNKQLASLLQPIGVFIKSEPATGGDSDTGVLYALGVPCLTLDQDGYDYFNVHHTPDDVLERINKENLNQVVASWSATLWMIASTDVTFIRPAVESAN